MSSLTRQSYQNLPTEIILAIIQAVVPEQSTAIFPASHSVSRTLLACTTVCRATNKVARQLLLQHCTHIDSSRKLRALVYALSRSNSQCRNYTSKITSIEGPRQLFLSPFRRDGRLEQTGVVNLTSQADMCLENGSSDSHPADLGNYDISEYEAIEAGPASNPLNDMSTAKALRNLLIRAAPTLQRLVIDIPLRSLYPEDDVQGVRPLLHEGFSSLANLEEFVSVQDELFLDLTLGRVESPIWASSWPKLRRIALYNVDLDAKFWIELSKVHRLEIFVFCRSDGLRAWDIENTDGPRQQYAIDVKEAWIHALGAFANHIPKRKTNITMCFVEELSQIPRFTNHHLSWRSTDPGNCIRVLACHHPDMLADQPSDNPIEAAQDFIRSHALNGSLFNEQEMEMRIS